MAPSTVAIPFAAPRLPPRGPSANAHPLPAETFQSHVSSHWRFPRVRRQTFAPIVRTTAAAQRKPPAKRLPARPPEFAVWRLPPAAQPDAPTVTTHPWCLPGKGTLLDCPPQPLAEPRLRPNARRHPFRPPPAAVAVFPLPHLTSSPFAPTRGIPPNPPAEKRCPRRCRKLPAPAPPETAAAPFGAVESKPPAPAPCAAVALTPGAGSPSLPTCFSGRNVSTGSGSHGN